jgi:hypothetical protein
MKTIKLKYVLTALSLTIASAAHAGTPHPQILEGRP